MKKLLLVLFLMVFLCGCVSTKKYYMKAIKSGDAQITSNIKVAVIQENWYWPGVSSFLPRALITEFLDLGFTVIERSQLERLFQEIKLDMSGAVKEGQDKRGVDFGALDKSSIKKMGEMLGVDALLLTYIIPTYDDNISKATFRLVDIETAKVLFSITLINPAGGKRVSTKTVLDALSSNIKQMLEGYNEILTESSYVGQGEKVITIRPQITKGKKEKFVLPDKEIIYGEIIDVAEDTITILTVSGEAKIINRKALAK